MQHKIRWRDSISYSIDMYSHLPIRTFLICTGRSNSSWKRKRVIILVNDIPSLNINHYLHVYLKLTSDLFIFYHFKKNVRTVCIYSVNLQSNIFFKNNSTINKRMIFPNAISISEIDWARLRSLFEIRYLLSILDVSYKCTM